MVMQQGNASANVVIRASAGTGKTFQLSNRFISLSSGGNSPDQILAATFARKAAGEILDRVLLRLAEAALDAGKLRELATAIGDPDFEQHHCLQLLATLLQRLHRLRIGTLDSFFIQVAGCYSLELGLPPGWRIVDELDDQRLRTDSIQMLLSRESPSDLLTLLHLLNKGDATRSVTEDIRGIVNNLYDVFRDTPREAWHAIRRMRPLSDEDLESAITDLEAIAEQDSDQLTKAIKSNLADARKQDWIAFFSRGIARRVLEEQDTYYRNPIPGDVIYAYMELVDHGKAKLVNQVVDQTEGTWRLLDKFDAIYRRLKSGQRALRFDDVTRTLETGFRDGVIADVSHRLDMHLMHLLLDEFQDTSLAQWAVVRPFAERVTAAETGRSFFCVGDVKQAIYGWRGGVSEIFDAINDELPGLKSQTLAKSYRSSQVVIDVVNKVFENLTSNSTMLDQSPDLADEWQTRFKTHSTALPNMRGYARLITGPSEPDGEQGKSTYFKFVGKEIARIARAHPGKSVGVLVRRNAIVGRLIYELRSSENLTASEEGGNPVTDSAAVQLILSLMRIADHPGDTVARYHVGRSAFGAVVGLANPRDDEAAIRFSQVTRETLLAEGYGKCVYGWARKLMTWCDQRELSRLLQLVELAYAYEQQATVRPDDFVAFISNRRVEDPTAADIRVMNVHQSKGLEFDIVILPELSARLAPRVPTLVVHRETATAPIDQVCRYARDEVQGMLPRRTQDAFEQTRLQSLNEALCVLYVALTRAAHAVHMIIPAPEKAEGSSGGTYAGLLRIALAGDTLAPPETVLYEHGDPDWDRETSGDDISRTSDGNDHATEKSTARKSPSRRKPTLPTGQKTFLFDDESDDTADIEDELDPTIEMPVSIKDEALTAETVQVRLAPNPPQRRRGLDRASPSGLEGGPLVQLADRLRLHASTAATRGTLFHAWFEQVEWLNDGPPPESLLQKVFAAQGKTPLDFARERDTFCQMLEQSEIRRALSREYYADGLALRALGLPANVASLWEATSPKLSVWRERRFAVRLDDTLLQGTVDRLVLISDGSRVCAADIVDFKTDRVETPEEITHAAEHYRPQINAYREAISQFLSLEPSAISARLLFLAPGVAIPIGADVETGSGMTS